jgi:hypothetical protein
MLLSVVADLETTRRKEECSASASSSSSSSTTATATAISSVDEKTKCDVAEDVTPEPSPVPVDLSLLYPPHHYRFDPNSDGVMYDFVDFFDPNSDIDLFSSTEWEFPPYASDNDFDSSDSGGGAAAAAAAAVHAATTGPLHANPFYMSSTPTRLPSRSLRRCNRNNNNPNNSNARRRDHHHSPLRSRPLTITTPPLFDDAFSRSTSPSLSRPHPPPQQQQRAPKRAQTKFFLNLDWIILI